ncbi:MAG: hypothetical protein HYY24_02395 [Verrucomicrobia bacterium]|nr:hypothetical protein [Verrucomicrobiota bacterium]
MPGCTTSGARSAKSRSARPRISILTTDVHLHSHGQHFIDRFLEGYGWQGQHYRPRAQCVSLYVDQFPENDLARERERRHGVKIYPTIAEALTLGGSNLAVDGVLIIAEHGKYPRNEKGQTRYPRYQFFKEVVQVFEASGRAVPVFNDKHLSTTWPECVEMVADARRLGFPFLAGSSLPVTWRIPSIEMPLGTPLEESVCVCYGGVDSYDFHGLETAQCMSERRAGGEAGVKSIHAVRGERIWPLLAGRDTTKRLLFAALARSHTVRAPAGYTVTVPTLAWIRQASPDAVAYFIEHYDGFRTAMFLLNGLVQDFTYAGLDRRTGKVISCQMDLPMPGHTSTTADFFNPLVNNIERMVLEGVAPYPAERTLLTSGMTLFAVESLHRGQVLVPTPEMKVAYHAPKHSTFWRA